MEKEDRLITKVHSPSHPLVVQPKDQMVGEQVIGNKGNALDPFLGGQEEITRGLHMFCLDFGQEGQSI